MTTIRVAAVAMLLVVASATAVGVVSSATPSPTATPADDPTPMGARLSAFMQASAGQTGGAVGNAMWGAAFERAAGEAEQRDLVERRTAELDATVAELQAERRTLREAYRNGTIDRTTYLARLSTLVGQLAAVGDGIEQASDRADEVGVNATRLDELRTQARTLGGDEVSRLARTLAGGSPPGGAGVFDAPGQVADRGSGSTGGQDVGREDRGRRGPPTSTPTPTVAGNATATASPTG